MVFSGRVGAVMLAMSCGLRVASADGTGAQPVRALVRSTAAPAGHDLDLGAIDRSVNPCEDFYRYANGRWLAQAKIPANLPLVGTLVDVNIRHDADLRRIIESAAADRTAPQGSVTHKVGGFYRSGMDEARIEADGTRPLAPELARIANIHDVRSLEEVWGHLRRIGISAGPSLDIRPDPGNSARLMPELGQAGLSLPEPGYYLRTDLETRRVRDAYRAYVGRTFVRLGETPGQADRDANAVVALEAQMAAAAMTPVEERDPQATSHPMSVSQLDALTPGLSWKPFFAAAGLAKAGDVNLTQPRYYKTLGTLMASTRWSDWQAYVRWHLLNGESTYLSRGFVDENFRFYGTVLRGQREPLPRWRRVMEATTEAMDQAVGQLYVQHAFSPAARARALALVMSLKAVLRDRLTNLEWMSPATRRQAIAKLDAMAVKIGYPDTWDDYSRLRTDSPSYVVNRLRAEEFQWNRELRQVGKPVDRSEWHVPPSMIDAMYDPRANEISFPAAILQAPMFDPEADDALNYGAIGVIIGHEMTHGFDDQGRQFDAAGNLHDWWTAADAQAFQKRARGIIAQYSAYTPLEGRHINGELTVGENIADIGGVKIAYMALERTLQGKAHRLIDGLTPEQRFFLSYAQLCRVVVRPEAQKAQLLRDPHAPFRFRVNGPLADMPEFRRAFAGPEDASSGLAPAASIW